MHLLSKVSNNLLEASNFYLQLWPTILQFQGKITRQGRGGSLTVKRKKLETAEKATPCPVEDGRL